MDGALTVKGIRGVGTPDGGRLGDLDATLRALPVRVRKRLLGAASLEMAKVGLHTARRLVRVRTGRLKRSIVAKRKRVRGPGGAMQGGAVLRAGARWAAHATLIEYGTSRARAFPFVRPAVERHHRRMLRAARGRIRRILPRVVAAAKRRGGG